MNLMPAGPDRKPLCKRRLSSRFSAGGAELQPGRWRSFGSTPRALVVLARWSVSSQPVVFRVNECGIDPCPTGSVKAGLYGLRIFYLPLFFIFPDLRYPETSITPRETIGSVPLGGKRLFLLGRKSLRIVENHLFPAEKGGRERKKRRKEREGKCPRTRSRAKRTA